MKNKKVLAKNALKEIREMFQASGITEAELQASGRKIHRVLVKQLYFNPEQKTPSPSLSTFALLSTIAFPNTLK